jgi:hypothetical protein
VVYEDQQDSAAAVGEEELVRKCPYQEMNQQSEKTLLVYIQKFAASHRTSKALVLLFNTLYVECQAPKLSQFIEDS